MTVKQEPLASPPSAVVANRLAKYAYATPSPNRRPSTKSRSTVKVESPFFETALPSSRPNRPIKIEEETETASPVRPAITEAVKSEHEAGPSTWTVDSNDDLESLTEDVVVEHEGEVETTPLRRSSRSSALLADQRRRREVSSTHDSEDGTYEASSEGGSEPESSTRARTRIRNTRVTRAERHLVSTPTRPALMPTRPIPPIRRKRRADDEEGAPSTAPEKRKPRAYAGPETYQHLKPLPDILAPDLDLVFCGINPGLKSSKFGHHFAHPTNKFWRAMHYSGMVISTRHSNTRPADRVRSDFSTGADYRRSPPPNRVQLRSILVDRPTAEQSELSTYEMRLNALPFTEKLLRLRPRVVCFVGKKIWDVYESVITKTAGPVSAIPANRGDGLAKLEPGLGGSTPPITPIKAEPIRPEVPEPVSLAATPLNTAPPDTSRREARSKARFDWTQPRAFRLPHLEQGEVTRYTYFWVVPNTSGLERTPLAEQIVLFGHLNKFKDEIKVGRVPQMDFREFDLEGVRRTVEKMQRAAEAREPGTPGR